MLLLGDAPYRSERLTLPHEQVLARRFVLIPLLELDFELRTPDGTRLADALARCAGRGCEAAGAPAQGDWTPADDKLTSGVAAGVPRPLRALRAPAVALARARCLGARARRSASSRSRAAACCVAGAPASATTSCHLVGAGTFTVTERGALVALRRLRRAPRRRRRRALHWRQPLVMEAGDGADS